MTRDNETVRLLGRFTYGDVDAEKIPVARACRNLAIDMVNVLGDSPELSAGLRKLLDAEALFLAAPRKV